MLQALRSLDSAHVFTYEVVDVDTDEALVAQYDELVPVLIGNKKGVDTQLCHYFFDQEKVKLFLING